MIFTDTHAHLYLEKFEEDLPQAMARAIELGVERVFLPNIDRESLPKMLEVQKAYPQNCWSMAGLHPCDVKEDFEKELDFLEKELRAGDFVAVGEIGIDLYWDKTFLAQQKQAFARQIEWAKELEKPIVIHVRDSFDEVFDVVDGLNDERLRGIFHCFTGTAEQAQHILDYNGFLLGLGGVLTFKNSGVAEVVKEIDLKHLVLETDAPFLAPTPHRGKRNESSFIPLIAQKLADIKEVDIATVAEITTANSKRIFGV